MNVIYNPDQILSFFDDYGEQEWERFQADPTAIVSRHLHTWYQQLEINSQKVQNAGFEHAVDKRDMLDITDLSEYPCQMFEAVVAYGGPLSYVLDRVDDAIVIKPGGHLLLSVISLLGSTRKLLSGILADVDQHGLGKVQQLLGTGDHHGAVALGHNCHLYRWAELKEVISRHPCRIVSASAANFLSVGSDVLE